MRTHIHHAAVALALVAGAGAANAQTVITREITEEPVETIIERGPGGTVITRRPLEPTVRRLPVTLPPVPLPAGTAITEVETIAQSRETVGSAAAVRSPVGTVATRRVAAPPARMVSQKQKSTRSKAQSVRTTTAPRAVRTTTGAAVARSVQAPVPVLTAPQRSTIYRTIVEERAVPRTVITERNVPPFLATPAVRDQVVTERVLTPSVPIVRERIAPRVIETVGAAPASVELAVGARLPPTVPLYALPDTLGLQFPAVRAYRYAVVDDRVFLVDPASSLIVEEIER
jgi:Protein of unknown function (DUF1236)